MLQEQEQEQENQADSPDVPHPTDLPDLPCPNDAVCRRFQRLVRATFVAQCPQGVQCTQCHGALAGPALVLYGAEPDHMCFGCAAAACQALNTEFRYVVVSLAAENDSLQKALLILNTEVFEADTPQAAMALMHILPLQNEGISEPLHAILHSLMTMMTSSDNDDDDYVDDDDVDDDDVDDADNDDDDEDDDEDDDDDGDDNDDTGENAEDGNEDSEYNGEGEDNRVQVEEDLHLSGEARQRGRWFFPAGLQFDEVDENTPDIYCGRCGSTNIVACVALQDPLYMLCAPCMSSHGVGVGVGAASAADAVPTLSADAAEE